MKKFRNMRGLVLALALVLPLLGLTLAGCTAQDAVDIAAVVVEGALEALEEAETSETSAEEPPETAAELPVVEPEPVAEPEPVVEPASEPEPEPETEREIPSHTPGPVIDGDGEFDDKENVALYIHTYGKLPRNYITKAEAQDLGWEGGSVERYAPGKCIGGSKFGNYEGLLPKADGRQYYECDIDTLGESSRGAKRIVYSNDGLIYYTDDHYETFELLYE